MRAAVVGLLVALLFAGLSNAQLAKPQPPTYFLVDSSGSMGKDAKRQLALEELTRRMAALRAVPRAKASFTFFGGDNGGGCGEPVVIQKLDSVPVDVPKFPTPAGVTQLGQALSDTLEHVGSGSAHIVIISDGSQSCGVDICKVAADRLPMRRVTIEPVWIAEAPEDKDRLGCLSIPPLPPATEGTTGAHEEAGFRIAKIGQLSWRSALLIVGLLSGFAFSVLRLLVASRFNESVAAQEATPKQHWKKRFSYTTAILAGGCVTVLAFNLSGLSSEFGPLYARLNDNLPSMLIAGGAVGFIGWVLLQTWTIYKFRLTADSRKWMAKQAAKDFDESEKPDLERRRATLARRAAQLEQRHSILRSTMLNRDALQKGLAEVQGVLASIELAISIYCKAAAYEQRSVVRDLSTLPRNDYEALLSYMLKAAVVQPAEAEVWSHPLASWMIVKSGDTEEAEKALNRWQPAARG
jgi:hypothetical protein